MNTSSEKILELDKKYGLLKPTRALVTEVRPCKDQPREYFPKNYLNDLARSIRTREQKDPVTVREVSDEPGVKYEIIDGECRWRACQLAGVEFVRIYVDDTVDDPEEQHFTALILNFHKLPHTHMEISNAIQRTKNSGKSVLDIADGLGKSDCWVYEYLSLQNLIPELQNLLHPDIPKKKED